MVFLTFNGFALNAEAAEKNNFLPEGWRFLGEGTVDFEGVKKGDGSVIIQPFAPAPSLTSLTIVTLVVDDKNEIHIMTQEIGTARAGTSLAWWNGTQCSENINEGYYLWGSDNIAVGYVRFFHTGVIYSSNVSGQTVQTRAQATNAMNPWNTITTSKYFTIP